MATAITPATVVGPYPTLQPAADSLDVPFAAADVAGNTFAATGRELLVIRNSGVGARTVTITSVVDDLKRTGDITTYSIGAGEYFAFWFGKKEGWATSANIITFTCSHAECLVAVLRLPNA